MEFTKGNIPNTQIEFIEIEKYDIGTEKGKWQVNFNGSKVGDLIATGHPMCPSEFNLTSSTQLLAELLKDFKDNCVITNIHNLLSFEDNYVLFDTDEVAIFEENDIKIIDEDLLGYFINDMSAEIKDWVEVEILKVLVTVSVTKKDDKIEKETLEIEPNAVLSIEEIVIKRFNYRTDVAEYNIIEQEYM